MSRALRRKRDERARIKPSGYCQRKRGSWLQPQMQVERARDSGVGEFLALCPDRIEIRIGQLPAFHTTADAEPAQAK